MLDKVWDFIGSILHLLVFWAVIAPYERGVLIRLGVFKRELDPGFHWCLPFHIDSVLYENVVWRTERLSGLSTTTADGKSVGFEAIVTYKIRDIQRALLEVNDLKDAIADSCAGIIGAALSNANWESIRHGDAIDALTAVCRKRGFRWGVEIDSIQLTGIALVKNLRLSMSGMPHPGKTAFVNFPT